MPATSPKSQSKAIADTVVSSIVDRLMAEAKKKGGVLRMQDLQGLKQEFGRQAQALQAVFEQSFEAYVKARERASWDQARNYPFDRVIVKRFSNLFADDKTLKADPAALSRRILPGFFMALGMMVGPEVVEEYQERCRKIVARVKKGDDDSFSWEQVYADPESYWVAMDAQVAMATYFEKLERRQAWFIELVNGHLSPVEGASEASGWELKEASFRRFVSALFADLKNALAQQVGRQQLTERYGAETTIKLTEIVKQFK
ncbi:MAG: hypothetical protein EXQ86_10120 [Rhodospirillales bacterium]|nr:hypothetical protein [Rhodospirillales bacterium]